MRDILLPISTRAELFNLNIDELALKSLNKETDTIGLHAFTLDTLDQNAVAHCRNFAPLYDIPEESATGSSNGALACYLHKQGKLENTDNLLFEQGYSMNQPSHIYASLETDGNEVTRVQVGGRALLFDEKLVEVK